MLSESAHGLSSELEMMIFYQKHLGLGYIFLNSWKRKPKFVDIFLFVLVFILLSVIASTVFHSIG